MTDLPADMQEIRSANGEHPRRWWPFVRHQIQFTYGRGHDERVIADFAAEGPLHFPTVGQVVELQSIDVKVVEVLISYYTGADGSPVVSATVQVESAALFATTPEEPTP